MNEPSVTVDETAVSRIRGEDDVIPGVVLVFSSGEPLLGALPLLKSEILFGRGGLSGVELRDSCMSKRHASVRFERDAFVIEDLDSRNGTFVNGTRISEPTRLKEQGVLRTGETVSLLVTDIRPFLQHYVDVKDGYLVGPRLDPVLQLVMRAANGGVLHIAGETGSGKEIAARHFHSFGPGREGPFVAVNCAAIPDGVAERLFFGAKKGAYSGATADAVGYVQEADGGTLFLDEVGELDLNVQAKLLRVLETREVLALGAARPKKVDIQVCSATHQDLRQAVADGSFREDLFYRLGRPKVLVPSLRERLEEVPFLIDRQVRSIDSNLVAHATLVETAMLRPWPGNIRELLAEIRDAALGAQAQGKNVIKASHLAEDAGQRHESLPDSSGPDSRVAQLPPDPEIEEALRRCEGKVATAARLLGVHRNQLRRWLEKTGKEPNSFGSRKD